MKAIFESERQGLVDVTRSETGFVPRDCQDLVEATAAVIQEFSNDTSLPPVQTLPSAIPGRKIELHRQPYGGVAIVLPQNASLYLGVLAGLSAALTLNKVWIKPPSSCPGTANFLRRFLAPVSVNVVEQPGREFMDWATNDPNINLVHFIGSSEVGAANLEPLFRKGKHVLVDGNGNCYAYVSDFSAFGTPKEQDAAVDNIAAQLTSAATRFNGETCTATKGVVISPEHYDRLLRVLVARFQSLVVGDPADEATDIGPLFSPGTADMLKSIVEDSGGKILAGGEVIGQCLQPTLVEEPSPDSALVREGVFGPVLWVAKGHFGDFQRLWKANKYPLCASLYGPSEFEVREGTLLPGLSRLTLDGDSSLEDPLEPWGALPPSGNGRVETWTERYRRTVQIDRPTAFGSQPR